MSLANYIVRRRKALGMNRAALARVMWGDSLRAGSTVHTNYTTLESWEKEGVHPYAHNRKLLAKALRVPDMVLDLEEHGIPYAYNPETKIVEILSDA